MRSSFLEILGLLALAQWTFGCTQISKVTGSLSSPPSTSSSSSKGPTSTPQPSPTTAPSPGPTPTPTPAPTASPTPIQDSGAPLIANITGTLTEGGTMTILGQSFGSTGPTIQVFDNFEGGSNTSGISIQSATSGKWSKISAGPTYSTDYAISGRQSMKVDFANGGVVVDGNQLQVDWSDSKGDAGFFFSFWELLPNGKVVPGTDNPVEHANLKRFWVGNGSSGWPLISDYVDVVEDPNFGSVQFEAADDPNRAPLQNCTNLDYHGDIEKTGVWVRLSYYMRAASTAAGERWMQEIDGQQQVTPCSKSNIITSHDNYGWNELLLPGYGRSDQNSVMYYDDAYVATGPGARARVEIGNASTYSMSTNLTLLPPTSWNNTSVTVSVRRGPFISGSKAWIYVINAAGVPNQSGFQITLP